MYTLFSNSLWKLIYNKLVFIGIPRVPILQIIAVRTGIELLYVNICRIWWHLKEYGYTYLQCLLKCKLNVAGDVSSPELALGRSRSFVPVRKVY